MGTEIKNYINRRFNKFKKQATKLINEGYDTTELKKSIKKIRIKAKQENREITQRDLIQHLAIKLSKENKEE